MSVDPKLQPILDAMNQQPPASPDATTEEMRAIAHAGMEIGFLAMGDDPVEVASVVAHDVPVDGGAIIVRVYTPFGHGPFPGYLYIHGGGFWLGELDHFDAVCRAICVGARCVVASADY